MCHLIIIQFLTELTWKQNLINIFALEKDKIKIKITPYERYKVNHTFHLWLSQKLLHALENWSLEFVLVKCFNTIFGGIHPYEITSLLSMLMQLIISCFHELWLNVLDRGLKNKSSEIYETCLKVKVKYNFTFWLTIWIMKLFS